MTRSEWQKGKRAKREKREKKAKRAKRAKREKRAKRAKGQKAQTNIFPQEDLQNLFNNKDRGGGAGLEKNGNVEEPKNKKRKTDGTTKAKNARKPKAKP